MDPIFIFAMGVALAAFSSCVAYLWVEQRAAKRREKALFDATASAREAGWKAGAKAERECYVRTMEERKACGHRIACAYTKVFDLPGVGQRGATVCEACEERKAARAHALRKAAELARKCSSGHAAAHQLELAANEEEQG